MKAFVHLLTVLLLATFSTVAFAKVGPGSLEDQLAFRRFCVSDVPVTAAGDVTSGINGVVAATSADVVHITMTSTLALMPVPAKLTYALIDVSSNTTPALTCSSLVIAGVDQFGRAVSHVDTTVTESEETTQVIFSQVTSIRANGCNVTNAGTNDIFRLYASRSIGLGGTVSLAQIKSACIVDASDSSNVKCAALNDGTAADIQSALDSTLCTGSSQGGSVTSCAYALDTSVAMFGVGSKVALADGDSLCWTIKQ